MPPSARQAGSSLKRSYGGGSLWWAGPGGIALALVAAGAASFAARRFGTPGGASTLKIMDRVSLTPKHAVFVVRAKDRLFVLGTGPQVRRALGRTRPVRRSFGACSPALVRRRARVKAFARTPRLLRNPSRDHRQENRKSGGVRPMRQSLLRNRSLWLRVAIVFALTNVAIPFASAEDDRKAARERVGVNSPLSINAKEEKANQAAPAHQTEGSKNLASPRSSGSHARSGGGCESAPDDRLLRDRKPCARGGADGHRVRANPCCAHDLEAGSGQSPGPGKPGDQRPGPAIDRARHAAGR